MTPILTCPFCGKHPHQVLDDGRDSCHIYCYCDAAPAVSRHKTLFEEAVRSWNQRAPRAP
jgi:Lar family restriction alleviation protein